MGVSWEGTDGGPKSIFGTCRHESRNSDEDGGTNGGSGEMAGGFVGVGVAEGCLAGESTVGQEASLMLATFWCLSEAEQGRRHGTASAG